MNFFTSFLSLLLVQIACAQNVAEVRAVRRLRSVHQILKVEDSAVPKAEEAFAEREILSRLLQGASMSF